MTSDPAIAPGDVDDRFVPAFLPDVTIVPVENEAVVYAGGAGTLHLLDPIGALVCELFDGEATIAALAADLATVFDTPRDRIEADVVALVVDLGDQGLLAGVAGTRGGAGVSGAGADGPGDDGARIERALVDGC